MLADRSLSATHASARWLLDFVRYCLDPEKRVRELAQAVMEKNTGAAIKQHVIDYTRLLNAVANVLPSSPAFASAAYYHVRLMFEAGRKEARQRLEELLALKTPLPISTRNHFLALRMKLARNADEFFKFAQRAPAAVSYNADGQELAANEGVDASELNDPQLKPYFAGRFSFAADSVKVMNDALPLAVLKEAALGTALPAHLRRQLTIAAWTRAVLLDDDSD